jgi:hypothetical protein
MEFTTEKKVILSLTFGIISSILGIPVIMFIFPPIFSYIPISTSFENFITEILNNGIVFYSIALLSGLIGIYYGYNSKRSAGKKYAVAGISLSIIGIITSLLFFGLLSFFSKFQ